MQPSDQEAFTAELLKAVEEARSLGYPAKEFKKMLNADGGFVAVKRIVPKREASTGFVKLYELGRLDLSCEAFIVETRWRPFFEQDLVSFAEDRLTQYGYRFKAFDNSASKSDPVVKRPDTSRSISVEWTLDTLGALPAAYFEGVLRNSGFGSHIAFGKTGKGVHPNYQVTQSDGTIVTYRGNNHSRMQEGEFLSNHVSASFSVGDLLPLRPFSALSSDSPTRSIATVDSDGLRLLGAYSDESDPQFQAWLPRYRGAVDAISTSLRSGDGEEAFSRVWMAQDNDVSNAGQGTMSHEVAAGLRGELKEVLRRILVDGSPESYEAIISDFEQWKARGVLRVVPRLVIARAFASIHPEMYHTTVDSLRQERVIAWCQAHLGFRPPSSASWAQRAAALTAHLNSFSQFRNRMLERNMFPWFVELHSTSIGTLIPAANAPVRDERSEATVVVITPERQREIRFHENRLQNQLARELRSEFGNGAVWIEKPTGNGTRADIFVETSDGQRRLYEIKVEGRALLAIRNALGQLVEYSYLPGGLSAHELIVAAEPEFDSPASDFIDALRHHLNLAISYRQIVLPAFERETGRTVTE